MAGVALPLGAYGLGRYNPPPVADAAEVESGFNQEVAALRDIGLDEVERGETSLAEAWSHTFSMEGGECVGVVVGAVTAFPVDLSLRDRREVVVDAGLEGRHVSTVTWCDEYASQLTATVDFGRDYRSALLSSQSREGTLRWAIFRGRTDRMDILSLARGRPSRARINAAAQQRSSQRFEAREQRDLPGDPPLFPLVEVAGDALLLPASEATFETLRAGAVIGTPLAPEAYHPAVQPSVEGAGPTAPWIRLGEDLWRVIAVVNPADLPVEGNQIPCVRLRFGRLHDGPATVLRVSLPGWREEDVPTARGVATDQRCASDEIAIYAVPAADRAGYRIRTYRGEGPTGRRSARRAPSVPEAGWLRETEDTCGEGALERCLELARVYRDGTIAPEDPAQADRFFAQACSESTAACIEWSDALRVRDAARSRSLLEVACEGGTATACAVLGDRYRRGDGVPFNAQLARRFYGLACDSSDAEGRDDVEAACRNLRTMDLLEL